MLTQYGQDLSDYITGINPEGLTNIHQRAIDAGLVGGFMGATGTTAQTLGLAAQQAQYQRQAQLSKDFYLSLGEDAKASELRQKLPKMWKEHSETITSDGPIKDVFIDSEDFKTYAQSKNIDPTKLAQELGISEQFEKADNSGGDISIPLPEWVDKVVDTEHFQGLSDDVRLKQDALSNKQARILKDQIKVEQELAAKELAAKEKLKTQFDQDV